MWNTARSSRGVADRRAPSAIAAVFRCLVRESIMDIPVDDDEVESLFETTQAVHGHTCPGSAVGLQVVDGETVCTECAGF